MTFIRSTLPDVRNMVRSISKAMEPALVAKYVSDVYGRRKSPSCPFTGAEMSELLSTNEILVYLPANHSPAELCECFGIEANISFHHEKLIKNARPTEDQWFITSASTTPELLYRTARYASRIYEGEGLHGMDLRRYLAFCAAFKWNFGTLPDQSYWTFLLSGSYDRSGISIAGFDGNGILSHHAWMRDFKAKFCGTRYAVLPPRIEITSETAMLSRAYRGRGRHFMMGKEAGVESGK